MPDNRLRGLKGLRGLTPEERQQFMQMHSAKLSGYRSPRQRDTVANILYMNKQFIDTFGQEAFNKMNDGSQESFELRNQYLREKVIGDAFTKTYSPFDAKGKRNNNKGLGAEWEKYNQMSLDAKEQLLNSNYKTVEQLNKERQQKTGIFNKAIDFVAGEAIQQYKKDSNTKVLNNIYNADTDNASKRLSNEVSNEYFNSSIAQMSDEQIEKAFVKAITPGTYNLGISEYASHYGDGSDNQKSSEMEDFSIDEKRQVLAKKAAYEKYMSPEMAANALNNEAKRYIKAHQGSAKRFGLFLKDVGISALSYTADKVNGIYNLGLMAADKLGDKPIVYVDDRGSVVDPKKAKITQDGKGHMMYKAEDNKYHYIHQEQIDRTTLHNMGRNFDGSEDDSILNPQYWTRAEQFGTLDENEQKQYEKLGSSPYKVAYNPGEDSDLMYEAFKMASFGIADAGSMLIPFGIGMTGRALSTASKAGKAVKGLGKALDTSGRYLTAQTRAGQLIQGGAGALGIAYAYQRGSFQETLAKNLASAEEAVLNSSAEDVDNLYQKDKNYKAQVDSLINVEAAKLKNAYIAQAKSEGIQIADEKALDEMVYKNAYDNVLRGLVQQRVQERKASKEYADLQQKAIDEAGDAAVNTFLPEAIKYGFVNTLGYRKFLYTNPAGLSKKVSSSLKGLKEITTESGKKRLATETSKFLTSKDKWKQFGKTLGSQAWGGAWTNGTDDMQVDAAERMSDDSFNRYLNQYHNGEAIADTYGFIDGLWSYFKSYMSGLQNSVGQETTWRAATVGGLGSIVNFTPNFANLAHLASREGREAYKNSFRKEIERDKNGVPLKNEDGSIKYKDINDWRGQINYFVQNGVLNTYYGNKQSEKQLQSHADYINNILDSNDDFSAITQLVASNIAHHNAIDLSDEKTLNFINAINAVNVLNSLGKTSKDPEVLSSVIDNAKNLIEKASQLNKENGENPFSEDEINSLLSQYYAANPGVLQSGYNNWKALHDIGKNAEKLMEATKAYNSANEEIQKIEKSQGINIPPAVKNVLLKQLALNNHWQERVDKMKEEIDDSSSDTSPKDSRTIIASTMGGIKGAESLVKVYDRQKSEYESLLSDQKKTTGSLHQKTIEALKALDTAERVNDSDAKLAAKNKYEEANAAEENSKQQEKYYEDLISKTVGKRKELQSSINEVTSEGISSAEKILTADEIFSLDPVTRARMMYGENRKLYSKAQQAEIEKLEQRLILKDVDALQKIQDIGLLTQRIAANQDAYSRVSKNPLAAALAVESQIEEASNRAYDIINQRSAEDIVDSVNNNILNDDTLDSDQVNKKLFDTLKKHNSKILDILYKDNMLPQHQKQVENAKDWRKVVEDIRSIVSNSDKSNAWKINIGLNLEEKVFPVSTTRDELINNLEKIIDDVNDPQAEEDFEYILEKLVDRGYLRNATIIESRKERKQREEEAKKALEEEAKRKEEAVNKAAEESAKKKAQGSQSGSATQVGKGEAVSLNFDKEGTEENNTESNTIDNNKENTEDNKENNTADSDKNSTFAESNDNKEVTTEEAVKDTNKLEETDGYAFGNSSTFEEQANSAAGEKVSSFASDAELENKYGEEVINNKTSVLSGLALPEFIMDFLKKHILKRKKGKDDGDPMNRYFVWMRNHGGIHLQNIVDRELAHVIKANPHAKVKFMAINPTKHKDMKTHLMIVLDYDNAINKGITSIHDSNNGGVIEGQDGKKYLVIGVVGGGDFNKEENKERRYLYDLLWNSFDKKGRPRVHDIFTKRNKFFDNNEDKDFYVHEGLSTEIVPNSLTPGYIIKQTEEDSAVDVFRPLGELLNDEKRNPFHFTFNNIKTGIQGVDKNGEPKFIAFRESEANIMRPRDAKKNVGRAFVLIPAGNGKFVPSYINPLKYNEMKEGALKNRIDTLLESLLSQNYMDRYNALLELQTIFHIGKDADNILIGTPDSFRKNTITFAKGQEKSEPFYITDTPDKKAFMDAFIEFNPRINITRDVLMSANSLAEYDEAGALMTDAALLSTAGSNYSIYGVDKDGSLVNADYIVNVVPGTGTNNDNQHPVHFKYATYHEDNGEFYLNGEHITDPDTIVQLQYNRRIDSGKLKPVKSEKTWEFFIMHSGEHPLVIKVDRNSHEVVEFTEEQSLDFIKQLNDEKAQKEREKAAKEANKASTLKVDLGLTFPIVNPETGMVEVPQQEVTSDEVSEEGSEEKKEVETPIEQQNNNEGKSTEDNLSAPKSPENTDSTQTFTKMMQSVPFDTSMEIMELLQSKWKDLSSEFDKLEADLEAKGIEVHSIGTSEADIQAWIDNVKCIIYRS